MAEGYKRFTETERQLLSEWKKQGLSNKECARRLGRDKSTIGLCKPLKLIFYCAFTNKYDALDAERYFKSSAGKRRIEKMLMNFLKENLVSEK